MVVRQGIGAEGTNAMGLAWLVKGMTNQENLRLAQLRASIHTFQPLPWIDPKTASHGPQLHC